MKFLSLTDIEIIQCFIKIGSVIGLTTYFEVTIKLWQKIMLIISSTYYTYVVIYFINFSIEVMMSDDFVPTERVLILFYSITFKTFLIVVVINMFIQKKNIKKLCAYLNLIEKEFNKRNVQQKDLKKNTLLWLCVNIFYISWEIYYDIKEDIIEVYTIKIIQYCIMFCILFIFVIFAYVKSKSICLNNYISSLLSMEYYSLISHIKAVENLSRTISIITKLINKLLGPHVIHFFLFLIITVLTVANLAITFPEAIDGVRFSLIRILFSVSMK